MRFVLTVDHGVRMRKHLCNVLIVECIYLLILCEGVVQHIHDYAGIIHHAQCVKDTQLLLILLLHMAFKADVILPLFHQFRMVLMLLTLRWRTPTKVVCYSISSFII